MANPNTAVFPTAVATDLTLPPATNQWRSLLTADMAADDTTATVLDNTGLTVPFIGWIDNEGILFQAKSGTTGLTVASGGRGFDGTLAARHAAGTRISANITAWHLNQAFVELIAIQAALGVDFVAIKALKRQVVITASGTWTVPAGVTLIEIEAAAPGGGGSNVAGTVSGAGGGAGDYHCSSYVVTPGTVLTITIGAAGAGHTAGAAGSLTISGTGVGITLTGGVGVTGSTGGASGSGSTGTAVGGPSTRPTTEWNFSGAGAGAHNAFSQDSTLGSGQQQPKRTASASVKYGGHGGGTPLSPGGQPGLGTTTGNVNGSTPPGFGGGGGGGSYRTDAAGTGAAGAPGGVIIRW